MNFEADEKFSATAYQVRRNGGIAWHVLGWETEPTEDGGKIIFRSKGGGERVIELVWSDEEKEPTTGPMTL